jgi:hypothetical protein
MRKQQGKPIANYSHSRLSLLSSFPNKASSIKKLFGLCSYNISKQELEVPSQQ